jgi:N-acetylglucosaminyl-diphospho-decaprenol L-rhamnosyltransferase
MEHVGPQLSIGIVLHNSAEALLGCLRSVRPAVQAGWAEVIGVDNASPDDGGAVLQRELPGAQVLRLERNRGFAAGANVAMARARGRYWLLLNPDVRVPADGLEKLVAWMDCHPRHGVASPDLVGADGRWQAPGRAFPSIGRTLLELTRAHRALPPDLRGRVLRGPYWIGGDQLDAGWVPGASMIVRPTAARQVGPLREDLFLYGEDLEWCARLARGGWLIGVCASTTFVHDTSSSARLSFGEEDTARRVATGIDGAQRVLWGSSRARTLAALTAMSHGLESCAPGRAPEQRLRARRAARAWSRAAAGRPDSGCPPGTPWCYRRALP